MVINYFWIYKLTEAISRISAIISSASFLEIQPRSHHRGPTLSLGCMQVAKDIDDTPLLSFPFVFTWTVSALAMQLKNTSKIPILKHIISFKLKTLENILYIVYQKLRYPTNIYSVHLRENTFLRRYFFLLFVTYLWKSNVPSCDLLTVAAIL